MTLFTLGYEGLSIETFISVLLAQRIEAVCDARELPLSRKPGFSKVALSQALKLAGIEYQHAKSLGCPTEIRAQYKRDKSWSTYQAAYRKYLRQQHSALSDLATDARKRRVCIVCFEADHTRCHRSIIADVVGRHVFSVTHLKQIVKLGVKRVASADR